MNIVECVWQGRIQAFEKGGAKLDRERSARNFFFAPPAKLLRTPPYRAVANRISNSEKKVYLSRKRKEKSYQTLSLPIVGNL